MADNERLVILFNPRSVRSVGDYTLPMGLIMTAVNIYQKYRVVILDQIVDTDWQKRLANLLDQNPVCVGVTAMTGRQIKEGLQVSAIVNQKGVPVVWGGIHASLMPEQTLKHPMVDYVIAGEGEDAFPELLDAIVGSKDVGNIPGIWSEIDGQPFFGGTRDFVDLKKLPQVPYHLVDLGKYIKNGPYGPALSLYSSRGCPQQCRFCYNQAMNQSRWRSFSADRVLEDIDQIRKQYPQVKHFQFWDDNFFASLRRSRLIAEGFRQLGPSISWSVLGTHIREVVRMDDKFLELLQQSNLTDMLIGVESCSQRIIDIIKKNFRVQELFDSNIRLGRFNIRPTYTFISGIPGEKEEDIRLTVDAMFKLRKDNPDTVLGNIKPFVCYPGTELYDKALELGFQPPDSLEDWSEFVWGNYVNLNIPWVPKAKRKFLNNLYYYTVLMNPDYLFIDSKLFTFVSRMLCPLAFWRVKRLCFAFPIEAWAMNLAQRLLC